MSSFDDLMRATLAPLYDRVRTLERDAESMQKLVGQLALGEEKKEEKAEIVKLNREQCRIIEHALEFTISNAGPDVPCNAFRFVLDWLRREL